MTERILVPKTPLAFEQRAEIRHRFHDLGTVLHVGEALVDLQEGHDVLDVPQVARRRLSVDLAIHRVLEQDGAEDPIAVECRRGDDPGTHFVDDGEHLVVVGPGVLGNAIQAQCLGRAAATLVECGDESGLGFDLVKLLFEAHCLVPLAV
jgi:hypothetical protein